ncbi:hypothetical protein SDC9_208086 [bioreactor metagenome]|uniref:Uncharacterized protein n=1 Tax=bioreactor metagenome TaxID=1076179 RepID=A0A645J9M4_9ZZZZ
MARTRFFGGIYDGTLFHLRHAARHAYHHSGLKENASADNLAEKMVQQALRNIIIGDHAVP